MEAPPQVTCTVCSNAGHSATHCTELSDPLKNGFYSGGGHSHTEDE